MGKEVFMSSDANSLEDVMEGVVGGVLLIASVSQWNRKLGY